MRCVVAMLCLIGTAIAAYPAAAQTAAPAVAEAIAASPDARARYADSLRRLFLSNGIDYGVYWPERRTKNDVDHTLPDKYPRLVVFGYMNNATVYQLITTGGILKNAKAVGFRSVMFFSKGSSGGWWWDISRADLPQCDINRRLCL